MDKTILIQSIRAKYESIQPLLHERVRRIWAATEARQIGWGGIGLVEEATGMSHTTISRGLRELESGDIATLPSERSRMAGGGRKNTEMIYTDIHQQLDALIDPLMRVIRQY